MLQEMHKFNYNFAKPEAELVVTKRVNSELCKRIVTMERLGKYPVLKKRMFRGGWNISTC